MKTPAELERREVLSLVRDGRITPHEAERLLTVLGSGEESLLKFATVVAIAWLGLLQMHQLATGVAHAVSMAAPKVAELAQMVAACVTQVYGGVR